MATASTTPTTTTPDRSFTTPTSGIAAPAPSRKSPPTTASARTSMTREGIYVNLFVPSRVRWTRGSDRITLTQRTAYPHRPETEIEIAMEKPAQFPVYLRIPAWAGPRTTVSVNGTRVAMASSPAVSRHRARVAQRRPHRDRIRDAHRARSRRPAASKTVRARAWAAGAVQRRRYSRPDCAADDLLAMEQISAGSTDWQAKTAAGTLTLRPFPAIGEEHYRLYLNVEG